MREVSVQDCIEISYLVRISFFFLAEISLSLEMHIILEENFFSQIYC